MKYIVMECHYSYAVLLDEKGRFVKAANFGYVVGQVVTDPILIKNRPSALVIFRSIFRAVMFIAFVALVIFLLNKCTDGRLLDAFTNNGTSEITTTVKESTSSTTASADKTTQKTDPPVTTQGQTTDPETKPPLTTTQGQTEPTTTSSSKKEEPEIPIKVSAEDAQKTALSHAGFEESQVSELVCEMEYKDGIYQYDVEFTAGGYEYEYTINAENGSIISVEKETA